MGGRRLSGEQSVTRTSELQIYNESRGIISAHFQDERKITREKQTESKSRRASFIWFCQGDDRSTFSG